MMRHDIFFIHVYCMLTPSNNNSRTKAGRVAMLVGAIYSLSQTSTVYMHYLAIYKL